jgi:hypothetical protein
MLLPGTCTTNTGTVHVHTCTLCWSLISHVRSSRIYMYYQEVLKYTLFTYVNVKYRSRCTRYPLPYHVVYMWYLYHVSSVYRYHMYVMYVHQYQYPGTPTM